MLLFTNIELETGVDDVECEMFGKVDSISALVDFDQDILRQIITQDLL